jgi:cob(I)alamin adenosyltransferase
MSRMYTRTGNGGETGLFSGERVLKDSLRVEAYGTVDELSCWLGYARSLIKGDEIDAILEKIQEDLFIVGAELATRQKESHVQNVQVTQDMVKHLEKKIDSLDAGLPPLSTFIIPNGTAAAAALHVARAVARRAERRTITLAQKEKLNPPLVPYLNRLSSLLFVLARVIDKRAGVEEKKWSSRPLSS